MLSITTNKKRYRYAWVVWFIAALFYAVEFFQRVAPGVIAKPLLTYFHLHAETLGLIISLYYYAYAIAQIPVGIILDRFGSRIPLTLAAFSVSIGTLLFATTPSIYLLSIARIIIGIGSAFAFVGCLKVASDWFPKKRFSLIVGLTNTLGVIGALFGEEPLTKMVQHLGWHDSLIATALIGMLTSILIFTFVKNNPKTIQETKKKVAINLKNSIYQIIKTPQSWLIAVYAGLMVAPIIAFAELWSIPFLESTHHFSANIAAQINAMIFIGIACGGPINGYIAGKFRCRKLLLVLGNILSLATLLLIIFSQHLFNISPSLLYFIFGFFTSSMLLCFTINCEHHAQPISATVIAFTNMIIMIIGAMFQPVIGYILDKFLISTNIASYTAPDFHIALSTLPLALVLNLILVQFIKTSP